MADLYCPRCTEPYDLDEVYHTMSTTQRADFLAGRGCCASCAASAQSESFKAIAASAMYELLGDDLDGAAAMLEDLAL